MSQLLWMSLKMWAVWSLWCTLWEPHISLSCFKRTEMMFLSLKSLKLPLPRHKITLISLLYLLSLSMKRMKNPLNMAMKSAEQEKWNQIWNKFILIMRHHQMKKIHLLYSMLPNLITSKLISIDEYLIFKFKFTLMSKNKLRLVLS